MITRSKRLSASIFAAIFPLIGAAVLADCPDGKIEVIRTTPSGKTHTQCVSENAAGGMGQAADNSAGTVIYATFTPLGQLIPGGSHNHQLWDISADGTVIVGIAYSGTGAEAFRWTESDGMIGLGDFEGGRFFSAAYGVSADGSVVVGRGEEDSLASRAFRWSTESNGMMPLEGDDCTGTLGSTGAFGVSGGGTIIAGGCDGTIYRWTKDGGKDTLYVGNSNQSAPFDIAANGDVIVGRVYKGSYPFGAFIYEAFRWTEIDGMEPLGALDGASGSFALGVSPDGSVIVGRSGFTAMQWTEATKMVALPGENSYARDASTDGSVIVGDVYCGGDTSRAAVWIQGNEPLFIQDLLESQGVDLSGWWLTSARAVTPDGRTIAGEGVVDPPATCEEIDDDVDHQLWIATLPLP